MISKRTVKVIAWGLLIGAVAPQLYVVTGNAIVDAVIYVVSNIKGSIVEHKEESHRQWLDDLKRDREQQQQEIFEFFRKGFENQNPNIQNNPIDPKFLPKVIPLPTPQAPSNTNPFLIDNIPYMDI